MVSRNSWNKHMPNKQFIQVVTCQISRQEEGNHKHSAMLTYPRNLYLVQQVRKAALQQGRCERYGQYSFGFFREKNGVTSILAYVHMRLWRSLHRHLSEVWQSLLQTFEASSIQSDNKRIVNFSYDIETQEQHINGGGANVCKMMHASKWWQSSKK